MAVRDGGVVTFANAATQFLVERGRTNDWKATTRRDYAEMLAAASQRRKPHGTVPRARIMKAFGSQPISQISSDDVRRFLNTLEMSPRSANKQRQVLYAVFKYAIMRGWRPDNPVQSVASFRKAAETELMVCSPEQVALISRSSSDSTTAAMLVVAAATGLRQGELLALRWRHVRFTEQAIDVVASYSGGLEETNPKGRRRRSVPMADAAARELGRLVGERPYFNGPDDLVFCGATGQFIDPATVRKRYVQGSVSSRHDPIDAIEEALIGDQFNEIILSTLPHSVSLVARRSAQPGGTSRPTPHHRHRPGAGRGAHRLITIAARAHPRHAACGGCGTAAWAPRISRRRPLSVKRGPRRC